MVGRILGVEVDFAVAQQRPRAHQTLSEQILPTPPAGMHGVWVVGPEANAPNRIERRGFNDDFVSGAEQESPEVWILRELGEGPAGHDPLALGRPSVGVEVAQHPAKLLHLARGRLLHNLVIGFVISKEQSLLGHHKLLRAGEVALARRVIRAAQNELRPIPLRGPSSPEEKKVSALTAVAVQL